MKLGQKVKKNQLFGVIDSTGNIIIPIKYSGISCVDPKIIIYDEPTTGLDPITAKEIIELMKDIQLKYRTSSLIITHDIDCARVISNRMILLIDNIFQI